MSSLTVIPAHAAWRAAYRTGLGWWARVLARELERVRLKRVDGVSLVMLPGVFDGVLLRSGAFLARALTDISLNAQTRVLDLGTGSGIGAVSAARRGAQVIASDINPAAARCARINALVHQL
ncbi:MAG: 50S ribosomal protein L11 methyltransferase, partial [Chloroflexi bacterium]|nr:50S ribosomal protein L11 methyltransferase [Chloroflexota bacterium]